MRRLVLLLALWFLAGSSVTWAMQNPGGTRRIPIFTSAGIIVNRVCSGFVTGTDGVPGTVLTTAANTNCAAANTCWMGYQEGGNASVTFSSSPSATWVDTTNNHSQSSGGAGDTYVAVASGISPGGSITFTATTASEDFRRLTYICFSSGNASAIDTTCVAAAALVTSPAACATPGSTLTATNAGSAMVCIASNNDGTTGTFGASAGFTLDPNMGGANGILHDTNVMYRLNPTGAITPQMTMTITGGAVRFQCTTITP